MDITTATMDIITAIMGTMAMGTTVIMAMDITGIMVTTMAIITTTVTISMGTGCGTTAIGTTFRLDTGSKDWFYNRCSAPRSESQCFRSVVFFLGGSG